MALLKNFIIVLIIVGILTRVFLYLFAKKLKKDMAIFLAFFTVAVIILPIVSLTIGFDVAVSEYVVALAIWLLFDLMRIKINSKKTK